MQTTTATTTIEKLDPLTRIQEEIKEVVRREQEHRQLTTGSSVMSFEGYEVLDDAADIEKSELDHDNEHDHDSSSTNNSISISPVPHMAKGGGAAVAGYLAATQQQHQHQNGAGGELLLTTSVTGKESIDGHHSDDSGISGSSSPVNGLSAHVGANKVAPGDALKPLHVKEQRYIGPNCYNMTPEPPQQKLMTRTVSTPHLANGKQRQFNFGPAHKGVMQRFIASRGKMQFGGGGGGGNGNNSGINTASNKIMLNAKSAAALMGANLATLTAASPQQSAAASAAALAPDFDAFGSARPYVVASPAVIERDADGRPLRPGYVPVEVKIQRELKDLKTRESELKKIRKVRLSTSDLLDSIDNENADTDDEDDSEVEHCYGPGQLRSAKSISELCESTPYPNSMSPRDTPSPDFDGKGQYQRSGGMRPAMSLAQLCDLEPEEAPSSHRLIAQWESLIQQNA